MTRGAATLHRAFLLHRRPYSNHSLLVECFTAEAGRFPAIARGVKSGKGKGLGLLQPFVPLLIGWSGRGEVQSLNRFESAVAPLTLQGKALYCGFYLNELLMRLLQREDPCERLFEQYSETLAQMAGGQRVEVVLRRFEIALLKELGYGLILDRDIESGALLVAEKHYRYLLEQGPAPATGDEPHAVRGSTLLALNGEGTLDELGLREARELTRRVLSRYLGDKPLKSRELFRSWSKP